MKIEDLKGVVHSDREIMGGTPVFVGTRVPLQNLIDYLEGGESIDAFLNDFPGVKREQVITVIEAGRLKMLETFLGNKKPVRILCIDDQLAPLDALKCVLEPHGYEVLTMTDSIDAMRVLLSEPIDLVIQDLARPGINGFEFYAMLKANEQLRSIPVVICSAAEESRREFLDHHLDAAAILEKPFDVEHLVDVVRKVLLSRHSRSPLQINAVQVSKSLDSLNTDDR